MDRRDLESALSKKGFEMEQGDHRYYTLVVDGKETAVGTMVSMGTKSKELGPPMVSTIAKQLRLTKEELKRFVACNMSEQDYIQHLRSCGVQI